MSGQRGAGAEQASRAADGYRAFRSLACEYRAGKISRWRLALEWALAQKAQGIAAPPGPRAGAGSAGAAGRGRG